MVTSLVAEHAQSLCLAGFTIEPGSISVAGQACPPRSATSSTLTPLCKATQRCMPTAERLTYVQETCIILPQLKLVLDTGRCPQRSVYQQTVLLSHAHMDHIGGLPFHVSTRHVLIHQKILTLHA